MIAQTALITREVARSYQTGSDEAASSYSEIRLGRLWNSNFETKEILGVVLRTDDFHEWQLHTPPALHASPGHCKDPRVVDVDRDIDGVSVGRQFPAFDHMHLSGM